MHAKFLEVAAAFELLSDAEERARYDRTGEAARPARLAHGLLNNWLAGRLAGWLACCLLAGWLAGWLAGYLKSFDFFHYLDVCIIYFRCCLLDGILETLKIHPYICFSATEKSPAKQPRIGRAHV